MILCREHPKKSTKKTIRTNKFSKVTGYKINTQRKVAFSLNNEPSENEIKKTMQFTMA